MWLGDPPPPHEYIGKGRLYIRLSISSLCANRILSATAWCSGYSIYQKQCNVVLHGVGCESDTHILSGLHICQLLAEASNGNPTGSYFFHLLKP